MLFCNPPGTGYDRERFAGSLATREDFRRQRQLAP